jgi:hypothetical protein
MWNIVTPRRYRQLCRQVVGIASAFKARHRCLRPVNRRPAERLAKESIEHFGLPRRIDQPFNFTPGIMIK